MQRECPGCATDVETREGICPICGYEFPRPNPLIVGAAALVLIAILLPLILRLIRTLGN
jgi:hypothetical protein